VLRFVRHGLHIPRRVGGSAGAFFSEGALLTVPMLRDLGRYG
jgi:hypothetical protein